MSRKKEIVYHVTFWFFFIGLDQMLEGMMRSNRLDLLWNVLQTSTFTILQMLIFYLNYLWICPKTVPYKKWGLFAAGQVGLILLFPSLRFLFEEIIIFNITGAHNYDIDTLNIPYYLYDNSYYVIRILLFSIVSYFLKYLWTTNVQVNQLKLEKKQAELQALKNQLSPHFLFNSLNGFYSDLYDSNPKVAADILKLSEMLRYVTYDCAHDRVWLKDELVFLHNYIDLFKRRFDDNVAVVFTVQEIVEGKMIPSLLLIHFVENAFKHGITDDFDNPVTIELQTEGDRLKFSARNAYRASRSYDEAGIGDENVKQRLALLYPHNHFLETAKDTSHYYVHLNIPLS